MGAGIPHHRAAAGEYNFSDIKNVTLHGNATQAIFHLNTTVSPDFELMKSPTVIQELDVSTLIPFLDWLTVLIVCRVHSSSAASPLIRTSSSLSMVISLRVHM